MSTTRFQDLPVNVFNNATRARFANTSMSLRKSIGVLPKSGSLFKDAVVDTGVDMQKITNFVSSTLEMIKRGNKNGDVFEYASTEKKMLTVRITSNSAIVDLPNESIRLQLVVSSEPHQNSRSVAFFQSTSITEPIKVDLCKSMSNTAMTWLKLFHRYISPIHEVVMMVPEGLTIIAKDAQHVALKILVKELQIKGICDELVTIEINDDTGIRLFREDIQMGNVSNNNNNNRNNNNNINNINNNSNIRKGILGEYNERLRAPFKTSQAISAFLPSSGPKPRGKNVEKLIMDRASQLQSQAKSKSKL